MWRNPLRLSSLVLAGFAVTAGLASAQPASMAVVDEIDGRFIIGTNGNFMIPIAIDNRCDWAQTVTIVKWTTSSNPPEGKSYSVEAKSTRTIANPLITLRATGADVADYRVRHAASTQGSKTCVAASLSVVLQLTVENDPGGRLPASGVLGQPTTLVLTQVDGPQPSTIADPPTDGPGLDVPALGIPGEPATTVDPDEAFDGSPDETKPIAPAPAPKGAPAPTPPTNPKPPVPARPTELGPKTAIDGAGKATLNLNGHYTASFAVHNNCDWPQSIKIETNERNAEPDEKTVPANGTRTIEVNINPDGDHPGGDVFKLDADYEGATQGNKTCWEAHSSFSLDIEWVDVATTRIPQGAVDAGALTLRQTIRSDDATPEAPKATPPVGTDTAFGLPGTTGGSGGCAEDCFEIDTCFGGVCGDTPKVPEPPGGVDSLYQLLGGEMNPWSIPSYRNSSASLVVPAMPATGTGWMNPLGLLSRSFDQFVEWWMPTLEAAEQNVQKGLQFLISSQGGSTGKNLTMQVLNFTGKPVNLQGMLALEPLKKDAQQKMTQAFAKIAGKQLPTKVDLNAYCLEFLKLPPVAGQIMRVAPPDVQRRFEPIKKIMSAANRLTASGALKPDSNPAAYADSIKQWAIWTTQEKFNQAKFGEAFIHHARKNLEAAGQKWTNQIEDLVRQRVPSRWKDITQILQGAGAPVPQ